MATPPKTSQIGAPPICRGGWLDALRFIVASLMVIHHYQLAAPIPLVQMHPVFERGYLLTNFFLIDSGYVLARIYGNSVAAGRMGLGDFLSKRFLRLVPAHLVMATLLVGLVLVADAAGVAPRHPEWFRWDQLPAQFFLVQAYGVPGGIGWNAPTWSISALLGCYFAFPGLLKRARTLTALQALAVIVVMYGTANLLAHLFLHFPVYRMPLKYGFWRALPLFAVGVLLARVSETLYIRPAIAALLGLGAAATLVALQWRGENSLQSLAMIGIIILAAAAIPIPRPSRIVEYAALASFSMFITNEVVRIAWFGVVNVIEAKVAMSTPMHWALWACGPLLALGFAFAFFEIVDKPTQRLVKNGLGVRALLDRLPKPEREDLSEPATPGYLEVRVRNGPLARA